MTMFSRPAVCSQPFREHQQDLADDLARRQAALQAEQRGHAEFAIHRAADLARNADGIALALGHQHGFHGPAVVQPQQVAARSVGGFVQLRDGRESDLVSARRDRPASPPEVS